MADLLEQSTDGELLRLSYSTDDGAFAVARLRGAEGEFVAVGPLGHVTPGQHVRLTGRWVEHGTFGRQFKVASVLIEDPRTERGIRLYLGSGAVSGLGPTFAQRVVDHFGLDTLRILAEEPERLQEVEGIGKKRMEALKAQWAADRQHRELLATLRGYGLGAALANRIVERWGEKAAAIVAREPFRMCEEIAGIGFRTADAIARANGLSPDDPARAEATVHHLLSEAEGQGHCFLPRGELLRRAAALDLSDERVRAALDRLALGGRVVVERSLAPEHDPVFALALHRAERELALGLRERRARGFSPAEIDEAVSAAEQGIGLRLAPGQRQAVALALSHPVAVITGGPGTGKTTIVRVLVEAARRLGIELRLCAPTGRAARRLAEATGGEARTLHRLLEYNPKSGAFQRDLGNPIDGHGALVDEASMVDLRLAQALVRALPQPGRLVLVGDADQLPSVGAGRVLADVIASGAVPVATLAEVFRQAQDSGIVRNAWRVNRGEPPRSAEQEEEAVAPDFFVLPRRESGAVLQTLAEVLSARLPRRGFDPRRDVQVLTPMHNGPLGTVALNQQLQALLNPTGPALQRGERLFRVGDRVIQVRNNYELDVFNGDVGRVVQIAGENLLVDFGEGGPGGEVLLRGEDLGDLELAWAISIHKSQGSEYPAVIALLHRSHRIMLRRNLLYTAITRARRFACLIGDPEAIERAVAQAGGEERFTRLAERLAEGVGEGGR